MPYQQTLKDLVGRTPQAVGAILVDWEGEAVQEYCHCDPYDLRFIAAHKQIIISRLRDVHASSEGGKIEDIVVTTSTGHMIIGCIDKDYSLVMIVGRDCPMALALHHFRNTVDTLQKEI